MLDLGVAAVAFDLSSRLGLLSPAAEVRPAPDSALLACAFLAGGAAGSRDLVPFSLDVVLTTTLAD
jgi:hypothetical protein